MGALLTTVLGWFATNFLGRVLSGAGLALAGNYTFGIFITYFVNKALLYLANIPMIGMIGLAGVDKAISILITGAMIKIYLSSTSQGISIVRSINR